MDPSERLRAAAVSRPDAERPARVVAKGYGDLAEQIILAAREHGIFVHDAPELVDLLMGLDLDERIPARLYEVVAELLAWVAELDAAIESPVAERAPDTE